MTVSDWSQSIYLLTELQLVQGMLLLGERKRDRGLLGRGLGRVGGKGHRWRVRGRKMKRREKVCLGGEKRRADSSNGEREVYRGM